MVCAWRILLTEGLRPWSVSGEVVFFSFHFNVCSVLNTFRILPVYLLHCAFDVAVGEIGVLFRPFSHAREEQLCETHCIC